LEEITGTKATTPNSVLGSSPGEDIFFSSETWHDRTAPKPAGRGDVDAPTAADAAKPKEEAQSSEYDHWSAIDRTPAEQRLA
jgi:hypothetical protein